jgi:hypothetical protein
MAVAFMKLLLWFGVLGATFVLDLVWAKYTQAVTERQPMRAAVLSALIFVIGGSVVSAYVHDSEMLVPAAIGAFVGTYVACRKP